MTTDRVIALIDMDCFYVQVEAREDVSLQGVPAAVVQYNTWKGGGIIAVNYEARACGVTRQMRGNDAADKCPEIRLVKVPEHRDKADLTKYRKAGREVIEVLLSFNCVVERASIDEAYLDITQLVNDRISEFDRFNVDTCLPNTHIGGVKTDSKEDRMKSLKDWLDEIQLTGNDTDKRLAIGAMILEEMRAAVYTRTKFRCSAGLAHCKTLAKLCCGLNKPNKQTVLPLSAVPCLYEDLNIHKVRGLGGNLGDIIKETFSIETMGQLSELSARTLTTKLEQKTGTWLFNLCKGFDGEEVSDRNLAKSIGCSKNFRGPDCLDTKEKVEIRMRNLVEEVVERLEVDREDNNRIATGLTIGGKLDGAGYMTRAGPLRSYDTEAVYRTAMSLLNKLNSCSDKSSRLWRPKLFNISISASKFQDLAVNGTKDITSFFKKSAGAPNTSVNGDVTMDETLKIIDYMKSEGKAAISNQSEMLSHASTPPAKKSNKDKEGSILKALEKAAKSDLRKSTDHENKEKPAKIHNDDIDGAKTESRVNPKENDQGTTSESLNTDTPKPPKQQSYFKRIMQEMKEKEEAEKRAPEMEVAKKEADENEVARIAVEMEAVKEVAEDLIENVAFNSEINDNSNSNNSSVSLHSHERTLEDRRFTVQQDNSEDEFSIPMSELIPNLENFDPQILTLLPPKVRKEAESHVEYLKIQQKKSKLLGAFKKKATNSPTLISSSIKQNYESTPKISTPNSPISTRQSSLSTSKISTSTLPTTNQTQSVSNSPPVASSSTTSISNSASIASSSNLLAIDSPAATPQDYAADLDEAPCRECGELVSAYDLPEHLDFHFAQSIAAELRKEETPRLNQSESGYGSSNRAAGSSVGGTKRKRKSAGNVTERQAVKKSHKDISMFFNKV